eukprot:TRINITY_DN5351_c0_g1_i1.p3 TRINITY_DN5351_c0_g1~~TRINITY_DN5351_c0_g1_i1.p3  ORF type:complete len:161 (-),score=19.83 TRINITY_DN5351_c0_g1_i1:32-514(-)
MQHKFSRVYGCPSNKSGYDGTALFASAYSKSRNSPDLLLYGACGSPPTFISATAGNDIAFFVELDGYSVENATAQVVWQAIVKSASRDAFANGIQTGPTYAVFKSTDEIRSAIVFNATNCETAAYPSQCSITYAPILYNVNPSSPVKAQPAFDWNKPNLP